MQLTIEWLSYWLYFLRQNRDYRAYCYAKQERDDSTSDELEAKFEKIAELYSDWGDIYTVAPDTQQESFKSWLKERTRIFFPHDRVRSVYESDKYAYQAGHLLLDVPVHASKSDTLASINEYLDYVYGLKSKGLPDPFHDLSRLMLAPLEPPKYRLHVDCNKATKRTVLKAAYVGSHFNLNESTIHRYLYGHKLSVARGTMHMIQDNRNPFDWKLLDHERKALTAGTLLTDIQDSVETRTVKKYKKAFDAYVRNTIFGRFPDNS